MEKYAVRPSNGQYGEFDISTLFWGALIVVALSVACLLASKAIGWLRNRRKFDGVAEEEGRTKDPEEPWDQAISRPSADYFGDGGSGLGGMNKREQEEIFSTHAPRKVRKAMRARRQAREQAQKQSKRPN
jgi:hypothetical protein